jgi:hypothetical protein
MNLKTEKRHNHTHHSNIEQRCTRRENSLYEQLLVELSDSGEGIIGNQKPKTLRDDRGRIHHRTEKEEQRQDVPHEMLHISVENIQSA